jgi:hypothetical protein
MAVLVTTATCVAASAVCADMTPMFWPTAGSPWVSPCRPADDRAYVCPNWVCLALPDVDAIPIGSLARIQVDATRAPDPLQPSILVDTQDSLSLCLYALLSFGVCRSAPWVRKLSLGGIPAWHPDGDFLQVGRHRVLSPDYLTVVPIYCLIQTDCAIRDSVVQRCRRTTRSFPQCLLSIPCAIASRAPPFPSTAVLSS